MPHPKTIINRLAWITVGALGLHLGQLLCEPVPTAIPAPITLRPTIQPAPVGGRTDENEPKAGRTPTGLALHVGPRGGVYHLSKSGKKVYEKRH